VALLAATVKVAVLPSVTVCPAGCVTMATGGTTVSVALRLIALVAELLTVTR
jgi:hypothetical protein